MKAIRWLLKLVLAMITLPLILAVWLIKWFVVFLHHCSACRAAAAGAVLKPQGGNCAVLPYKLHGFCISKCKVAGGVCQAPVFLRKIVDVKVCEIYPAGLEKQV